MENVFQSNKDAQMIVNALQAIAAIWIIVCQDAQ